MAATLIIEEESGTCRVSDLRHGYFAGDFSTVPFHLMAPLNAFGSGSGPSHTQ